MPFFFLPSFNIAGVGMKGILPHNISLALCKPWFHIQIQFHPTKSGPSSRPPQMPFTPFPSFLLLLVPLQLITQRATAAEEFGLFDGHLDQRQTATGGSSRDIRSLANGRWQLRPGKRTSLVDFGPLDEWMSEGRRGRTARRIRKMYALLPPLNNWN